MLHCHSGETGLSAYEGWEIEQGGEAVAAEEESEFKDARYGNLGS